MLISRRGPIPDADVRRDPTHRGCVSATCPPCCSSLLTIHRRQPTCFHSHVYVPRFASMRASAPRTISVCLHFLISFAHTSTGTVRTSPFTLLTPLRLHCAITDLAAALAGVPPGAGVFHGMATLCTQHVPRRSFARAASLPRARARQVRAQAELVTTLLRTAVYARGGRGGRRGLRVPLGRSSLPVHVHSIYQRSLMFSPA
jgi:hypothetical protein